MKKNFAIFDMDGTLADSVEFWKDVGREYLLQRGLTEDLQEVLGNTRGMRMSESAAFFIEKFSLADTQAEVEAAMNAIMDGHYRNDISLKPGVREYLQKLAAQGVRMCVASTSDEKLIALCLSRLQVAEYFEFILSCETVGAGKKRPDVFLEAARRLGAAPSEIAVYEDMYDALETAACAGFYTIGVYEEAMKNDWERIQKLADEVVWGWSRASQEL